MREVVNGLMYILSTGCQWRAVPKDLPPKSTIYEYFDLWTYDGTLKRIHHTLYEQCREQACYRRCKSALFWRQIGEGPPGRYAMRRRSGLIPVRAFR
jgi:transposase